MIAGALPVAASIGELFLSVTAVDAPITVSGANLAAFSPSFQVFTGAELPVAVVPVPPAIGLLLGGLAALGWAGKRSRKAKQAS